MALAFLLGALGLAYPGGPNIGFMLGATILFIGAVLIRKGEEDRAQSATGEREVDGDAD